MTNIYVKNDSELTAAIKSAQAGDTILLATGTYAPVVIRSIDKAITITSATPDKPAVMTGLTLRDSSNITFTKVDMFAPEGKTNPYTVTNAKNITFDAIEMYGPNNLGSGNEVSAFLIRLTDGVKVINSEFHHLKFGVQMLDVENALISENYFHDIRTDGIRGGGVSNSVISNNHITDFYPAAGDHADGIQLWSTNQPTQAENITISGNLITRGKGESFQGIFVRDTFDELPFINVAITDNVVLGGSYNGISIDGVIGGTITGNVVAGYEDQRSFLRVIVDTDTNVSGNLSTFYIFDTKDSAHLATNNIWLAEKGVDYASTAKDFLTLDADDVASAIAKLVGAPTAPAEQTAPPAEAPQNNAGGAPNLSNGGQPQTNDGHGRTVVVTNDAELKAAIKDAQAGDVIKLATGSYAAVSIRSVSLDVTITSLDSGKPATLTGLTVRDASGVTLTNLKLAAASSHAFTVLNASDVVFDGVDIFSTAGNSVSPLIIRASEQVAVVNSTIHDAMVGIQILDVDGLLVSDNAFRDLQANGILGSGASNTKIADNSFTDFRNGTATAAAIQIYTSGQTTASENIQIVRNIIQQGNGDLAQGIVVRDASGKLAFENLKVVDNAIIGGASNGLMLEGLDGAVVSGNFVAGLGGTRAWIKVIKAEGSTVSDNTATFYVFDSAKNAFHNSNALVTEKGFDYSKLVLVDSNGHFDGLSSAEALAQINGTATAPSAPAPVPSPVPAPVPAPAPAPAYNLINGTAGADKLNGTAANDKILGGAGNDTIYGRAGDDYIDAGAGDDTLEGGEGNDILIGGAGNDLIVGGVGNDVMTGGLGSDSFYFRNGDIGSNSYDVITDYERGVDQRINLRNVDANIHTAIDDNFVFIGQSAFTKTAGQLKYTASDAGALVEGDLNGDGIADFSILIQNLQHVQAGDFML